MKNNINETTMPSREDFVQIIDLLERIVTSDLQFDELLNFICVQTQILLSAAGVVVEMAEQDEMVYRACSGTLSKFIGLKLKVNGSFSGHSVKTGEILYCEDSELDKLVDKEACRQVGARSMICVPLKYNNQNVGVLKCISPNIDAFSNRDLQLLKRIATILSVTIAKATLIEERANALIDVANNEKKFRTIFDLAHDGIMIVQDEKVLEVNHSFCKMFEIEMEELLGKSPLTFVEHEQQGEVEYRMRTKNSVPQETKVRSKSGRPFIVESVAQNLLLGGEHLRLTTIRDITEKKKAEELLRKSESEARELAKLKADFLANISHEIRTPLNGILGMASMLVETKLDTTQQEYTEIIRASGKTLLSLVNDILDFSKIESSKLSLENIEFNLIALFKELTQIFSFVAASKALTLEFSYSKNLATVYIGDPNRLKQILTNLINNAIKFTSEGKIYIVLSQDENDPENAIHAEIRDSGIGMSEEAKTQMFKPFSQADSSMSRRFGGTGLGLSICRQLVELMGGSIGVKSVLGEGSTFWFSLPLERSKTSVNLETVARVEPISASLNAESRNILVVGDEPITQKIIETMLTKLGHKAKLIAYKDIFSADFRRNNCDLIFLDCDEKNDETIGLVQVIRSGHENYKDLPIIAVLDQNLSLQFLAKHTSFDGAIEKPFEYDQLRRTIMRLNEK